MCSELPHGAACFPPQSWGDVGREIPRGEGRTRVCYPHGWHQSVPHTHGVLCAAGWACPHDLRVVRAADLSARGPPNGHARTMMGEVLTVRRVECRSSLKFITQATSTINPIYTLGKLVSLPLKLKAVFNIIPGTRTIYTSTRVPGTGEGTVLYWPWSRGFIALPGTVPYCKRGGGLLGTVMYTGGRGVEAFSTVVYPEERNPETGMF